MLFYKTQREENSSLDFHSRIDCTFKYDRILSKIEKRIERKCTRINTKTLNVAADFVTPKFYSRELEDAQNADVSDTAKKIAAVENRDPRDIYRLPLLSSHT